MKNIRFFLSENFKFLEVIFSIYLNRRVFVMRCELNFNKPINVDQMLQNVKVISISYRRSIISACIKGSLGVRDSQKLSWDFQKSMPGSLGLPAFKDI